MGVLGVVLRRLVYRYYREPHESMVRIGNAIYIG